MKYLLDTNACIAYLNGRSPSIKARLQKLSASEVSLCSVVKGELLYGVAKSQVPEPTRARLKLFFDGFLSLPFDDQAANPTARFLQSWKIKEHRSAPTI